MPRDRRTGAEIPDPGPSARQRQLNVTRTDVRLRRQDQRPLGAADLGLSPADLANASWPIGSIFISAVATDPATLLGVGTWTLFAQGRVLVGIDPSQAEFDTVLETGGEKTHVLTPPEVP